jgi:hypothetical protein
VFAIPSGLTRPYPVSAFELEDDKANNGQKNNKKNFKVSTKRGKEKIKSRIRPYNVVGVYGC